LFLFNMQTINILYFSKVCYSWGTDIDGLEIETRISNKRHLLFI
jgi:hypothetical protein